MLQLGQSAWTDADHCFQCERSPKQVVNVASCLVMLWRSTAQWLALLAGRSVSVARDSACLRYEWTSFMTRCWRCSCVWRQRIYKACARKYCVIVIRTEQMSVQSKQLQTVSVSELYCGDRMNTERGFWVRAPAVHRRHDSESTMCTWWGCACVCYCCYGTFVEKRLQI